MDSSVDVFVEPLSLLSSDLAEIAARIQNLENAHAARMEAAASRLEEALREKITTSLQERLDYEFQEGTTVIRSQFEERMRLATDQWEIERQALLKEIAKLRTMDRRDLSTEIAQTETALTELRNRIDEMVDGGSSVGVSRLLKATAREAELQAYLKGLKFKAGIPPASIADAAATETEDVVIVERATA